VRRPVTTALIITGRLQPAPGPPKSTTPPSACPLRPITRRSTVTATHYIDGDVTDRGIPTLGNGPLRGIIASM
jgi:hypothetical protein